MRYRVFGGVTAIDGDRSHDFSEKQAAVLGLLLAAHPDPVSRIRIIDEIWNTSIPKDPEAALHNIVSRLRSVVGGDLIRTATGYGIQPESIDVAQFERAVKKARQTGRLTDYAQASALWVGDPYPGLENLPSVGIEIERLHSLRARAEIERLALLAEEDPSTAVDEVRAMIEVDAFDERALGVYMRGLYGSGRKSEALRAFHDYEKRLVEETGLQPSAEIRELELAILMDEFDHPQRISRPPARLDIAISYIERAPGEMVAVGHTGSGSPILVHPGWLSKLDVVASGGDFRSPMWAELAKRHELVLFDRFGTGLSPGDPKDLTFRAHVEETKAVLSQTVSGPTAVLASSSAGPICIQAAIEEPQLVSHLILYGTFASGPTVFPSRVTESLVALCRASWGMGSDLLASLLFPAGSQEHRELLAPMQRSVAPAETAIAFLEDMYRSDVSNVLGDLETHCLVIHYTGDKAIPFSASEGMARGIPKAQLIPIEGVSHYPPPGDEPEVADIIDRFLETTET